MQRFFFVFCPNQIALCIAEGLASSERNAKVFAIYWPKRCHVGVNSEIGLTHIIYSRWNCLRLWLRVFRLGPTEVLIPHRKLGRFVNIFTLLCSTTSLVDDGLDTFRENPQNVDPGSFAQGTHFYTFRYSTVLGQWLSRFQVNGVADLIQLTRSNAEMLPTLGVRQIVIESPPLGKVAARLNLDEPSTLLVKHSNPNKQALQSKGREPVSGGAVALEYSLANFKGNIVVGESMVAVFALHPPTAPYRLTIWLANERLKNLRPLISLIEKRDYCTLKIC